MSRHPIHSKRPVASGSEGPSRPAATYSKGLLWIMTDVPAFKGPQAIRLLAHLFDRTEEEVRSDLDDMNG